MNRPQRVITEWYDPFDDRQLCSSDSPYCPREMASGHFRERLTKLTLAYKGVFSDILQGREPGFRVSFK